MSRDRKVRVSRLPVVGRSRQCSYSAPRYRREATKRCTQEDLNNPNIFKSREELLHTAVLVRVPTVISVTVYGYTMTAITVGTRTCIIGIMWRLDTSLFMFLCVRGLRTLLSQVPFVSQF